MLTGFLGSMFGKAAMVWVAGWIVYWIKEELRYKREMAEWNKSISDHIRALGLEEHESEIRRLIDKLSN